MSKDFLNYLLIIIFIGIILIIAMQYMAPTIGNVFSPIDPCGPCLCDPDGSGNCWNDYDDPVFSFSCSRDKCSAWKDGLPEGKLVVIIPKTFVVGDDLNHSVGFAYPPASYSKDDIHQIIQQYFGELDLSEEEAHVVELDILLGTVGNPVVESTIIYSFGHTYNDKVPTDSLTEWEIEFFIDEDIVVENSYTWKIRYSYTTQSNRCRDYCESLGEPYLEPSEDVEVRIKNIRAKVENFISRHWFPTLFYFLLLAFVVFFVEFGRTGNTPPE